MTASAWPGAGGRRQRLGVGAVACVVAVAVHVAGWLALKSMPTTGRAVQPQAAETARRALIVEWIAQRPAADARSGARLPRRHEPNVAAVRRPAPSTGTQNRSPNPEAVTKADAAANRVEAVRPNEPAAGVDWRHDLDAIGTPRSVRRSPAAAAIGALGASSGGIAQRRDTVDATLARGVSEARRADCRNAYAGMGLLAIPALALDTVRDAGCKW
ncbi:hypothetical protein [Burkholderia stagnalis]|uniref:hypothetical protein n=1 Tax=Burkholderia stagnalis TaxID=1503054 RepID=UPI00075E7825|nr:hypothetical protein [Burkholderia stagnalis]KVM83992.1 hypothetical protein WT05_18460 [Burkholderia stagnalis]